MNTQQWADWLAHPVTQAVIQHLEERKDTVLQQMLNVDIASHTTEKLGLHHLMHRSVLDGMGAFLDLEDLQESLVGVQHED